MTDEQAAQRGDHADRLLNDPLLVEMFERMEKRLFEAWRDSRLSDVDGRERAYALLGLVGQLKVDLRSVVNDGKVARKSLAERAKSLLRRQRA